MTQTLIDNAQAQDYNKFNKETKEILSKKVSIKLKDIGYFKRLDSAMNVTQDDSQQTLSTFITKSEKKSKADIE